MNVVVLLHLLRLLTRLRQRDRWTRQQLEEHQAGSLRAHAYAHSPFY